MRMWGGLWEVTTVSLQGIPETQKIEFPEDGDTELQLWSGRAQQNDRNVELKKGSFVLSFTSVLKDSHLF